MDKILLIALLFLIFSCNKNKDWNVYGGSYQRTQYIDSDKINKYVSDYLEKDDDKIDECDLLWEENLGFNKLPGELVIEPDEFMGPVIVYDNMASQMVVQYLKHNIQKILKENNMVNIFRMIFNVQYNNTLFISYPCKDKLIINPFDEVFDSFMFSNM